MGFRGVIVVVLALSIVLVVGFSMFFNAANPKSRSSSSARLRAARNRFVKSSSSLLSSPWTGIEAPPSDDGDTALTTTAPSNSPPSTPSPPLPPFEPCASNIDESSRNFTFSSLALNRTNSDVKLLLNAAKRVFFFSVPTQDAESPELKAWISSNWCRVGRKKTMASATAARDSATEFTTFELYATPEFNTVQQRRNWVALLHAHSRFRLKLQRRVETLVFWTRYLGILDRASERRNRPFHLGIFPRRFSHESVDGSSSSSSSSSSSFPGFGVLLKDKKPNPPVWRYNVEENRTFVALQRTTSPTPCYATSALVIFRNNSSSGANATTKATQPPAELEAPTAEPPSDEILFAIELGGVARHHFLQPLSVEVPDHVTRVGPRNDFEKNNARTFFTRPFLGVATSPTTTTRTANSTTSYDFSQFLSYSRQHSVATRRFAPTPPPPISMFSHLDKTDLCPPNDTRLFIHIPLFWECEDITPQVHFDNNSDDDDGGNEHSGNFTTGGRNRTRRAVSLNPNRTARIRNGNSNSSTTPNKSKKKSRLPNEKVLATAATPEKYTFCPRLRFAETVLLQHLNTIQLAEVTVFLHILRGRYLPQFWRDKITSNFTSGQVVFVDHPANEHPFWLSWKLRKLVANQVGLFDIVLVLEDDLGINWRHVRYWCEFHLEAQRLTRLGIAGFLRYDKSRAGERVPTDHDSLSLRRFITQLGSDSYYSYSKMWYEPFWFATGADVRFAHQHVHRYLNMFEGNVRPCNPGTLSDPRDLYKRCWIPSRVREEAAFFSAPGRTIIDRQTTALLPVNPRTGCVIASALVHHVGAKDRYQLVGSSRSRKQPLETGICDASAKKEDEEEEARLQDRTNKAAAINSSNILRVKPMILRSRWTDF